MSETIQDTPPQSLAELRQQIAQTDPVRWGVQGNDPVETSNEAFMKWMRKEK
jgi:hypothetical protein